MLLGQLSLIVMCDQMKAIEIRKYDGIGSEVDYETIINRYLDSARIELFSNEKIIKLNIRFDEVYHRCQSTEWDDFRLFLTNKGINIKVNQWWQFWER